MLKNKAVLKKLYNAFKPEPLLADDEAYVNYQAVRGDKNIVDELGQHISWSDEPTCSLFSGHRGCGKSTELLRLQQHLEEEGYKVIYFATEKSDIDPEDAGYIDILLACTRHILQELEGTSETLLRDWLKNIWDSIKEFIPTDIKLSSVAIKIPFITLSVNLHGNPTIRKKIRKSLEPHSVKLLVALNEFISDAEKKLGQQKLVLIVDNLDRIPPIYNEKSGKTNLEEIFIDRSGQLTGLACHVVYTVPISLVYSDKAMHLGEDRYEPIICLPVIKVREKKTRELYQPGVDVMLTLVKKRMKMAADYDIKTIFGNEEIIKDLCLISGGHLRNFVYLLRATLRNLPKAQTVDKAIHKAIVEMREPYISGVNEEDWSRLATVYSEQYMPNETKYRNLLFSRSILEYYEGDNVNDKWQDVHPVIWEIEKFKQAQLALLSDSST